MRARWIVLGLTLVLAFYLVLLGQRGFLLLTSGEPVGVALGIGVIILPVVGAWAVWRELAFGLASQRLGRELAAAGGLAPDDLPRSPGGRIDRAAADLAFTREKEQVEAAPDDWRGWYRLGVAYDVAGDRKRARAAVRHAIALHTSTPHTSTPHTSTPHTDTPRGSGQEPTDAGESTATR